MADPMQQARELLAAEYESDKPGSETAMKLRLKLTGQLRTADTIALRAIAAALSGAPEGFVMVPVEPTDEMCAAALARIKEVTVVIDAGPAKGATLVRDPYYHAYKAMLAARPQVPAP